MPIQQPIQQTGMTGSTRVDKRPKNTTASAGAAQPTAAGIPGAPGTSATRAPGNMPPPGSMAAGGGDPRDTPGAFTPSDPGPTVGQAGTASGTKAPPPDDGGGEDRITQPQIGGGYGDDEWSSSNVDQTDQAGIEQTQMDEVRDMWADLMSGESQALDDLMLGMDADESRNARRSSEMNASMGGSVGGNFASGQAQAQLSGTVARAQARSEHDIRQAELKMTFLGRMMDSAERSNDRQLQEWLQEQMSNTQIEIAKIQAGSTDAPGGALDYAEGGTTNTADEAARMAWENNPATAGTPYPGDAAQDADMANQDDDTRWTDFSSELSGSGLSDEEMKRAEEIYRNWINLRSRDLDPTVEEIVAAVRADDDR